MALPSFSSEILRALNPNTFEMPQSEVEDVNNDTYNDIGLDENETKNSCFQIEILDTRILLNSFSQVIKGLTFTVMMAQSSNFHIRSTHTNSLLMSIFPLKIATYGWLSHQASFYLRKPYRNGKLWPYWRQYIFDFKVR